MQMNYVSKNLRYIATACVAAIIGITAASAFGQESTVKDKSHKSEYKHKEKGFCGGNSWSSDERVSFTDLRELTIPATGTVNVDAGQNGGVSIKGKDRGDVLVRACVQAWNTSDEAARATAANIRINTSGEIKAVGPSGDKNWSVSYQILVPRSTNTRLMAQNGGISISGVDGTAEFETKNGGVSVSYVSGSVKGRTTNGGVNVVLSGVEWKGSGLDIQTTNGGVNLIVPENYAANVETGTVNGGYKSEIPSLNITTEDMKGDEYGRSRSKRISTSLNGGGAPIRIITTNGGVKISTPDRD